MTVQNPPIFIQSGSHPAEDVRRAFGALITHKGVFGNADLAVIENGTPNMTLTVAGGRVAIAGSEATYQGTYICENRGTTSVTISTADATNPRKDLVVAKVQDAGYSGATNAWSLAVVTGTPAGSPAEPAVPANCIVLAMVDVPALDTAITNSQITDRRFTTAGQFIATGNGGVVRGTSTNRPTSPLYEGMEIYETDTNRKWIYSGASWFLLGGLNNPRCRANRTAGDTALSSTVKLISFTAADVYDTDSMHDPASNPSRIILPFIGLWLVGYTFYWNGSSTTGGRQTWINVNAAGVGQNSGRYAFVNLTGSATNTPVATVKDTIVTTAVTDYIEMFGYQDSGGTLNIGNSGIGYDMSMTAEYIGPVF